MKRKKHSGGRKKSPLLFGITFRAILIVAAAAMLLSYLAVYVNPSKFSLPLFFGLYFIPILGINLLLLLIAILRRSGSAWIAVVALLPALLYTELFLKIRGNDGPQHSTAQLKIESYNLGMFSSSRNGLAREECRNEVGKHLITENPDIVCLQEFFVENYRQADTIFGRYPHRHYHLFKARNGKLFGNIILSRFPIGDKGRISFPNSTNLSIYADVEYMGQTLRIYNNHLESYNVSFASLAQKVSQELKKESRSSNGESAEEITRDIVQTHEKMKGTFIKRSQQVEKILENINGTPHRTIICGDFNDTPMSYTYHALAKRRKDTFKEAGHGFSATFAHIWPLLRIDYILVPDQVECHNHSVLKLPLSDHYPVISTVSLHEGN